MSFGCRSLCHSDAEVCVIRVPKFASFGCRSLRHSGAEVCVILHPNRDSQFQLLSDDGSIERIAGTPCKDINDEDSLHKYFRSAWIRIENA
jgi:hypothetical protein